MDWKIKLTRKANKDLLALNAQTRERILSALETLAVDPHNAANVKALKGKLKGGYRLRVGDYRVVYELEQSELVVVVVRVMDRREAYR